MISKSAILTIVILCASLAAFGQKSRIAGYRISATKTGAVTVTVRGKAHRFDLRKEIEAARVTETELLFAGKKGRFTYLVIAVSGWSKKKQDDRQCGAGTESNLVWLKLDPAWKIAGRKSVRYESCWASTELNDPFQLTKKTLAAEFDNFRDDTRVKLFYNADEPEKGFQLEETKIKEN